VGEVRFFDPVNQKTYFDNVLKSRRRSPQGLPGAHAVKLAWQNNADDLRELHGMGTGRASLASV